MDADGNIIPIVDDDQGEGFCNPIDDFDMKEVREQIDKQRRESMKRDRTIFNKGKIH